MKALCPLSVLAPTRNPQKNRYALLSEYPVLSAVITPFKTTTTMPTITKISFFLEGKETCYLEITFCDQSQIN